MRATKSLLNEVRDIFVELMRINEKIGKVPFEEYHKEETELFNRVDKLSENAGVGLVPGKHLQFGVADGYAHYVVLGVRKSDVTVEHLPFGDAYHFPGCYIDEERNELIIPRKLAEGALRWEEWRNSLRKKHHEHTA